MPLAFAFVKVLSAGRFTGFERSHGDQRHQEIMDPLLCEVSRVITNKIDNVNISSLGPLPRVNETTLCTLLTHKYQVCRGLT